MSTYQRWGHLNRGVGVWGVRGEWGVLWEKGKAPHMGPYLPVKIVCAPNILCSMVYGWTTEGGQ